MTKRTLLEVYKKYSAPDAGGDKGTAHTYIEIYELEMSKNSGITLLEIGVYEGHSIAMWDEYFEESTIVGVDIDLSNRKFNRGTFIKADATKPEPEFDWFGRYDYIIDDGSHKVEDQLASFDIFWPKLKSNGKYFIEDIRGDLELDIIKGHLELQNLSYKVYDHRHIKGRSDDILVTIYREL